MTTAGRYARLVAALWFAILLFVPIIMAGLPRFPADGFPIELTRPDAVVIFFVAVPLVFVAFAVYRIAQYHRFVGRLERR